MRILHLGFEDHRRPGSGGGSLRNHEVNRRLASRGHEVEVLTARYTGARPRDEDGVRYRPIGLGFEYFTSLIAYQAVLPGVVLEQPRNGRAPTCSWRSSPLRARRWGSGA